MKLSEQLRRDHDSGDFGKALEGYAERAEQLEMQAAELVKTLAACKAKDDLLTKHMRYKAHGDGYIEEAIAIQPDTSALEAIVKKAGEVMRERSINVAWNNEPDCNGPIEMGIRALPGVTLEDLK